MTREEEIVQAGKIYCKDCVALKFPSCMGNLKRTDILAAYRNGAEWADKTMIDKACEWLINHNDYICGGTNGISFFNMQQLVKDLRKYLEE